MLSDFLKKTSQYLSTPANCWSTLDQNTVEVVRACLKTFDDDISVDADPIPYLLISGYDEKLVTRLHKKDPAKLRELALQEQAKYKASVILAEIRHGQLCSIHHTIQHKYPILASEWRNVADIVIDHLPPELAKTIIDSSFTPEMFVRAYLGNTVSTKVYDLTPVWQQWAADNGLHPAYPNLSPVKNTATKSKEEELPYLTEQDPRLEWTTPYLGNDKRKAFKSLNILIKAGRLTRDFDEVEFHNLRRNITGIHKLKFSSPVNGNIPQKSKKGRSQLSPKEASIAQRIFNAWLEGTDWDTITDNFNGALTEILRVKKKKKPSDRFINSELKAEAKRLKDAARKWTSNAEKIRLSRE